MSLTADLFDAVSATVQASAVDIPVAHAGIHFEPPTNGQWLEVIPFFNGNRDYFAVSVAQGFFRIAVVSRLGEGINPALELAEAVATWFPMSSRIGEAVITKSAGIGGIIQDHDRITIPVTFHWKQVR